MTTTCRHSVFSAAPQIQFALRADLGPTTFLARTIHVLVAEPNKEAFPPPCISCLASSTPSYSTLLQGMHTLLGTRADRGTERDRASKQQRSPSGVGEFPHLARVSQGTASRNSDASSLLALPWLYVVDLSSSRAIVVLTGSIFISASCIPTLIARARGERSRSGQAYTGLPAAFSQIRLRRHLIKGYISSIPRFCIQLSNHQLHHPSSTEWSASQRFIQFDTGVHVLKRRQSNDSYDQTTKTLAADQHCSRSSSHHPSIQRSVIQLQPKGLDLRPHRCNLGSNQHCKHTHLPSRVIAIFTTSADR